MGAWNLEHFDNDTAMDWIYDFSMAPAADMLQHSFEQVIHNEAYIDADEGAIVLAAAEVIAAAKGKTGSSWPEDIPVFTDLRIAQTIVAMALQAIDKVASSDTSGLKQLWMESNDFEKWQAAVEDLKSRLQ